MSNSSQFETMHTLLSGLQLRPGAHVSRGGKPMHRGQHPSAFPRVSEGKTLKLLTPEQLLSVRVPHVRIRYGRIEGYQGLFNPKKAREVGKWITDNAANDEYLKMLPAVEISIENGDPYATDGQHRIAGAIIAGKPIYVVITRRTHDQARRTFALQGKAKHPSRNLLIFDGDGPFEEYIQDAVTSDDHPWSMLISAGISGGGSKTRMSATAAFKMLNLYVRGANVSAARNVGKATDDDFDREAADQLAALMSVFGTRQTNPLAYSSISLTAIAHAARQVFQRRDPHSDDMNRWARRMPQFQFANYAYLKSSVELANQLIRFWNKQLPEDRKAAQIS